VCLLSPEVRPGGAPPQSHANDEVHEELRRLRRVARILREERDIYFKDATLELHDAGHICKVAVRNGVSSTHEEVELFDPLSGPRRAVLLKCHLESDR